MTDFPAEEDPFEIAFDGVTTGLVLVFAAGGMTGREEVVLIFAAAT